MKLSTIFHRAADEYLPPAQEAPGCYSCRAVWRCMDDAKLKGEINTSEWVLISQQFEDGMEALGLDWGSFHAFDDVPFETRQATRYQWLKFCALLAEEQGV